MRLHEAPPALVAGLVAVEDHRFFEHHGISPISIARAAWANLRAAAVVQGGSTLTQQLAKNLFLSPERTLARKVDEAIMAVLLDARYPKEELLEVYLNEVYLGQEGRRAVHGFGLASWFYFGRRLDELDLAEAALLIGLARGASAYNPWRQPERARRRRDLVLDVMAARGVVGQAEAGAARARPLGVRSEVPRGASPHPAFIDLVRRQLSRDYRDGDLRTEGLRIFTALDPLVQSAAERMLARELAAAEQRGGVSGRRPPGRGPRRPGRQRRGARGGRRPAGAGPRIQPGPSTRSAPSGRWSSPPSTLRPSNEAIRSRTASRTSRSRSLSTTGGGGRRETTTASTWGRCPSTAPSRCPAIPRPRGSGWRSGSRGWPRFLERLGVAGPIRSAPSLLLGSIDLSPFEVAQAYQALANEGFRAPLRAIHEVTGPRGAAARTVWTCRRAGGRSRRGLRAPGRARGGAAGGYRPGGARALAGRPPRGGEDGDHERGGATVGSPASRAATSRWCGSGSTTTGRRG